MARRRLVVRQVEDGVGVTPLELFFDLVFVYAVTQVTHTMVLHPDWQGLVRALLLLALLWWAWVGYAWLGNLVRPDEGGARLVMFAAMAAMLVLALGIPEAFDDAPGGLDGPVVVALAYLAFRVLHFALFAVVAREDAVLAGQLWRFAPTVVGGTALLLVASQLDGAAQTGMWALALLVDYGGTLLGGAAGWRLRSPGHFAERHGLIIIVALGESIVAIGVGVQELALSVPILLAAVLGLAVSATLWWTYFDVVAIVAERVLARVDGAQRSRLGRDSYSYLHLPMVAGIVLVAFGLHEVLAVVGGSHEVQGHGGGSVGTAAGHLEVVPALALFGGTALYLLGQVAFRLRNLGSVNVQRLVLAVLLLAAVPLGAVLPAVAALAVLTAATTALIAYEALRFGDARERVRHLEEIAVSGHDPS